MTQTLVDRAEFVRASKIDGSGEYRFASVGDWDGRIGYGGIPSNALSTEHLNVKYNVIPLYLAKKFPNAGVQDFVDASLDGGDYSPAKFFFSKGWKKFSYSAGDGHFLIVDGEIYSLVSDGTFSNGGGHWSFSIRDVGNLSIVRNRLVEEKCERDGKFELDLSGDAPHHSNPPRHWRAWIRYNGKNPGNLVKEVVEYVNSEKERLKVPLWKKRITE